MFLSLVLSGCQGKYLSVRSEPLREINLASFEVKTPDPCRLCYQGERLVVFWKIPFFAWRASPENWKLHIEVLYGNGEEEALEVDPCSFRGFWTYEILNQRYYCLQGVQAFKVDLLHDGELIDCWRHHVWFDRLNLRGAGS